jgi:hypothetical protein
MLAQWTNAESDESFAAGEACGTSHAPADSCPHDEGNNRIEMADESGPYHRVIAQAVKNDESGDDNGKYER